jgi:hypothetical protein
LVEIIVVQVIGLVEDEHTFNTIALHEKQIAQLFEHTF